MQKYLPSSFQQQLIVFPLRLPFQRIFKLNQEFSFEPNSNLNNLTGQPSAYIRLFCTPSILFVIPPLWMPMTLSFSPSTNIIGLPLCPSKVEIKCMIWPFFSLMSLIAFFNDSLLANRKDIFLQIFYKAYLGSQICQFILLVLPQSKTATKLYETIRLFDFLL